MCNLPEDVRMMTDNLDSVGNTTAATGKGFAIGSAALTAMALLAAYLEEVRGALHLVGTKAGKAVFLHTNYNTKFTENIPLAKASIADFIQFFQINVLNPKFLLGVFIGAMVAFVFSSLTIKAVGRAAGKMVKEVRRQFKEIPGIMEGTGKPDYAKCVKISTQAAQREMLMPALVGLLSPIITGLIFGVPGVLGILAGALSTGFVLAVMMNNAGGAWDNAKKYIETEKKAKGTEIHKASIVGDTVGDPFKDTAGPCINILVKLMSMISIVFSGLIVSYCLHVENINPPFTKVHLDRKVENKVIMVDKDSLDVNGNYPPTTTPEIIVK